MIILPSYDAHRPDGRSIRLLAGGVFTVKSVQGVEVGGAELGALSCFSCFIS